MQKNRVGYILAATLISGLPVVGAVSAAEPETGDAVSTMGFTRTVTGVSNSFTNSFWL